MNDPARFTDAASADPSEPPQESNAPPPTRIEALRASLARLEAASEREVCAHVALRDGKLVDAHAHLRGEPPVPWRPLLDAHEIAVKAYLGAFAEHQRLLRG